MPSGSNSRWRRNVFERLAGGAFQQDAEHRRPGVVHPLLARLVHQRERGEVPDPLVRGVRRRWPRRAERAELELLLGGLDRVRVGRGHDGAEPHAERQQVVDGDRPLGRHGVVERSVEAAEHASIGELGEELVHRAVSSSTPSSTRIIAAAAAIGLVSEAIRKIASRWSGASSSIAFVPITSTCTSSLGAVVPGDERDRARHLARLDVAGHEVVQSTPTRAHGATFEN